MAEDQTAEEERQDSEEQEEHSGEEEQGEETQASAEGSDDSEEEEDEEEEGADERGESEGKIGDVDIDEVDPDEPTQDDDVASAQMRKLEKEGPPQKLEDWPTGKAMYLTFGGSEGGEGYEDGSPRQMGPSSLRHYPDGSVEVQGEMVDNPEDYKADENVFDEHEKMPMDKGAKTEDGGESSDEDESGDESSKDGASADGESSSSAQGDGSGGEEKEAEKAETS